MQSTASTGRFSPYLWWKNRTSEIITIVTTKLCYRSRQEEHRELKTGKRNSCEVLRSDASIALFVVACMQVLVKKSEENAFIWILFIGLSRNWNTNKQYDEQLSWFIELINVEQIDVINSSGLRVEKTQIFAERGVLTLRYRTYQLVARLRRVYTDIVVAVL